MPIQEHRVNYQTSNSFSTLNELTDSTKNIWFVFHGMGYLSRYFLRYFGQLDPSENFIIAPQAPSKYYQGTAFKHVGASWLTKEETKNETANVLSYVQAVADQFNLNNDPRLIVMGYSQGVSIATRWMASQKVAAKMLLLHSGGIPVELVPKDFEYLPKHMPVVYLYGDNDQYITEARKTEQALIGSKLFGEQLEVVVFKGVHEVNTHYLTSISKNYL
ncbi:MAG: esterase [Gilvibacter sp.]